MSDKSAIPVDIIIGLPLEAIYSINGISVIQMKRLYKLERSYFLKSPLMYYQKVMKSK
jgi:hypothetical protein